MLLVAAPALLHDLKTFPLVIVNVKVRAKPALETIPHVASAIAAAEQALADSGRVVTATPGQSLYAAS